MMSKHKPVALLLTATITPPIDCPNLVRSNPEVRMKDYYDALKFYLKTESSCIDRILFVENSDSDMGYLQELEKSFKHGKTVEFISFSGGNDYPPEYGKGYGEMTLIDYAIDNSKTISRADVIWKATGRLMLLNVESLIRNAPYPYEIYCDLHDPFKILSFERFFDPRFYSFTIDGYDKYFRTPAERLQYSHIEHYFYDILRKEVGSSKIALRFKEQPMIKGFHGASSTNADYFTWKKIAKRQAQQLLRSVAPNLWI